MNTKDKIKLVFKNPMILCARLFERHPEKFSDQQYLKIVSFLRLKYRINMDDPKTFNEKLNWIKLFDRNPLYTKMVDKYSAKKIAEERIGSEYIVPCYGVWDSFDSIEFDKLPDKFVLKTTHDSSGVVICKNKNSFDFELARNFIQQNLYSRTWLVSREWPYKDVKPRVIADEYLDNGQNTELQDYKFWCFNGIPQYMYITNKGEHVYENFYDMDFTPVDIDHNFPRKQPEYEKPKEFELMKRLAQKLSTGIPFVRIDFFDVNGHVYFGEFTFFDWGANVPFKSKETDIMLGNLISLNK